MGEAFITRRGGGIPYAVIGVTYPSGSVCTCTNGSKTLTAKDTSGTAMFTIPEAGTWTVTAVSGDKSASKAVEITAEGQVEAIELSYYLVLFDHDEGGDNIAVTGGWTCNDRAKIENDYIVMDTGNATYTGASAITVNTIDPRKYSMLEVLFTEISTGVTAKKSSIGVTTGNTGSGRLAVTEFDNYVDETDYIAQVDISDVMVDSRVYIELFIYSNNGSRAHGKVSRVRLIP